MEKILEFIRENDLIEKGFSEEESKLDEYIKEKLDDESLEKYLQLQDLLMTSKCEAEKHAYEKGFISAIRLVKSLSNL